MNENDEVYLFNKINEIISNHLSLLCRFNLIDLKTRTDIENILSTKLQDLLYGDKK